MEHLASMLVGLGMVFVLTGCAPEAITTHKGGGNDVHAPAVDVERPDGHAAPEFVTSMKIDTSKRELLQGLQAMQGRPLLLVSELPPDFSGSFDRFHREGTASVVELNVKGTVEWTTQLDGFATQDGYDGPAPYELQTFLFTAGGDRIWVGGIAARAFDVGLGEVPVSAGFILALDSSGLLVGQYVRPYWQDTPIKELSAANGSLAVRTSYSGLGGYVQKLEVMTAEAVGLWSRSVGDDPQVEGSPSFYSIALANEGDLVVSGAARSAKWDGIELDAPGFYLTPFVTKFRHDGDVAWVAKPVHLGGDPIVTFSSVDVRSDGIILVRGSLRGRAAVQMGNDELAFDCTVAGPLYFLSAISSNGEFLWTRQLPDGQCTSRDTFERVWAVLPIGGELYFATSRGQRRADDPSVWCERWSLKRLDLSGALVPVFTPTRATCADQPDWWAEIRMADLGGGLIAVGGSFVGEVQLGKETLSTGAGPDEGIYFGIIDLGQSR